jgi:hypothetical protein
MMVHGHLNGGKLSRSVNACLHIGRDTNMHILRAAQLRQAESSHEQRGDQQSYRHEGLPLVRIDFE